MKEWKLWKCYEKYKKKSTLCSFLQVVSHGTIAYICNLCTATVAREVTGNGNAYTGL